jgi:hypothetical protein
MGGTVGVEGESGRWQVFIDWRCAFRPSSPKNLSPLETRRALQQEMDMCAGGANYCAINSKRKK